MPLEYRIDPTRQVVFVKAVGTMTDDEVFGYQREVWSRPEVAGFDELIDMSDVQRIALPSTDRVRQLAELSARMDSAWPARLAIIAPGDHAYGLARMYAALREMSPGATRQVLVFRTRQAALAWLGIEEFPASPNG